MQGHGLPAPSRLFSISATLHQKGRQPVTVYTKPLAATAHERKKGSRALICVPAVLASTRTCDEHFRGLRGQSRSHWHSKD